MGCRCFEILGVDVMLQRNRKPYLIEVNHLPSFTCDSPLDQDIKSRVVKQALDMTCNVSVKDRRVYEAYTFQKTSEAVASAVDEEASATGAHQESLLNAASYQDFVRIYPPTENPKLALRYEASPERCVPSNTRLLRPATRLCLESSLKREG